MIAIKGATRALSSRHAVSPLLPRAGRALHSKNMALNRVLSPVIPDFLVSQEKRPFSTSTIADSPSQNKMGTVTRMLQNLDISVVRKIEEELREVDTDADGR
jgi:hypothetical protein